MGKPRTAGIRHGRSCQPWDRRRTAESASFSVFRREIPRCGGEEIVTRPGGISGKGSGKTWENRWVFPPFLHSGPQAGVGWISSGQTGSPSFALRRRLRFSTAALWRDQPSENRGSGQNPHDLSIRGAKFEVSSNRGRSGALSGRFPQGAVGRNCRSGGEAARAEHAVRRHYASSVTDGARFPQKFSTGCGNVGGKTGTDLGHGRWGRPAARGVLKRFGKAWVFLWFFLSLLSFAR